MTPFSFVADPATGGAVGAYLGAFIANETGGVNAADASSTRIDRLDVQVPDDPAGASPLSARIIYTAGSAGSGVAPGAPVRSFPVGTITVPKAGSGSPSFTPTWPYVAGPAGVVPVRSQAERDALAVDGRLVVRLDTGEVEKRIGGSWSRVGGKRSAWVTASPIFNGSGIGTFPHGLNWTPSTAIIGQNGVSGSSGVHVLFISADAVNVTCKAVLVTTGAVFAGNAGVSAFLGE
ncbi:MAG TPA: hypothetical protein VFL65_00875 [Jatrophihabitans sp.]|nr:hypothetical protein [Jatrophihabitans sp.]